MNNDSPQGQGFFSMNAPGGQSNRLDNVKLLEQGPNPGILYSMVDMGTHYNAYFKKSSRIIRLTFEFPLLKQLFRTTDTEVRPTVVSMEETFQISDKSNLKKFCDGALGKVLQRHEYKDGYNIGQFLGKVMIVTIVNKPSKKDPEKIYNNVASVQGLTEHNRAVYNINWDMITRTNDLVGFMIDPQGQCFQSKTFAKLPDFLRDRIKDSDEAKAYAQGSGTFIEKEEYENVENKGTFPDDLPLMPSTKNVVQRTAQAPPPEKKLVMIDNTSTYEAFIKSGWTNELLVEHGKAKWEVTTASDAPASDAPAGPPAEFTPNPIAGEPDVDPNAEMMY